MILLQLNDPLGLFLACFRRDKTRTDECDVKPIPSFLLRDRSVLEGP